MRDRTDTTLVMTGKLEDFRLADVLQVVGLSRQYTAVELRREDGRLSGTIWIKAGRVIGAQRDGAQGRSAFYDLFGSRAEVFIVSRLPEPSQYPQPLGPLASLLMEAIERASQPDTGPVQKAVPAPKAPPMRPPAPAARRATGSSPPPGPQLRAVPEPRPAPATTPPPSAAVDQDWDEGATIARVVPSTGTATVAIASPKGGVGKTTITLNLALALAQRGRRTIVIDADVNGDLMSLLAARDQVRAGAYDILDRPDAIDEVLRETAVPGLRILPASGPRLPAIATARRSLAAEWRALIAKARERADLVLVDCPAGMFDTTADVLGACSHVVGVIQSDMIATRSASMLERGLETLPEESRPRLVGVVVNMFQGRSESSVEAFHQISAGQRGALLFETTIPRSEAFAAASLAGLPVRFAPDDGKSPIAWLFEALATEVCGRAGLVEPARQVERFLR